MAFTATRPSLHEPEANLYVFVRLRLILLTDLFVLALPATCRRSTRRVSRMVGCRVPITWGRGGAPFSATRPPKRATSFSLPSRNCNSKDFSPNNFWTKAVITDTRYIRAFSLFAPVFHSHSIMLLGSVVISITQKTTACFLWLLN